MDAAKSMDLKARAGGLGLATCGGFLLKIGFFDVLRDAEGGETHVSTSLKAVLVAPGILVLGLLLIVIGAPGDGSEGIGRHFTNAADRRLKPLGWVLVMLMLLPGLVMYLWLQSRLSELGFE
jgi:hypothetical protein